MAINILQIHYDEASRGKLDLGFTPLEVIGNPRPDWREYWPIREFFQSNTLNEADYYGFLSPLFFDKTGLRSDQVYDVMGNNPGADVYTFSPTMSEASSYLSVFEQGERRHPGLTAVVQELLRTIGLDVDVRLLINDFRTTAFCNYIIAKPLFWDKWFAINERMFDIAESRSGLLAHGLNGNTSYAKGATPMKVFIMERVGSLVMALMPELHVINLNIAAMQSGDSQFHPFREEMVMLDALKAAYLRRPDPAYLARFYALRHELLRRCDLSYQSEHPHSFF